ncbi:MAG: glycerol-3-phosphate 1-O-acyltransferase PlsY [Verrucomicrobia bacterium]|nr:glycerol-3-phosphate 1-O-acyltransferase PlsY [Verrucomicrobiota bacterium]
MNESIPVILLIFASYLLGSIPNGLIIARLKGIDIRKAGSGNIGATNVFRSVGKPFGIATFIGDMLKGLIPAALFPLAVSGHDLPLTPQHLGLAFGCCAIVGHNWPVFLKFRGGKGVATSAGVLLGVAPLAVAVGLAVWLLLFFVTRYVSVGSMGAAIAICASGWIPQINSDRIVSIVLTMLGAVIVWRHRSNIQRLASGTENRFVSKRNS